MASHERAFEAAQRARWMRPDAYRWIRPDAARFLVPGTDPRDVFPALQRKFNPDQPRVPAGNPDGGQWTDGGGGLEQIQYRPERRPIDLLEERNLGGHAIERHVGRSDASLLNAVNDAASYARRNGWANGLREGSFPSLEAANKLVNSTVARNPDKVDKVVNGISGKENLDAVFGSPTGSEAYAATERSQPYIRETYGVRVVIVPDRRSEKGYRVETAFPQNLGR
jgi:hypothetical protein